MKKILAAFFALLLVFASNLSCGADWYYTQLDVSSELSDPPEFFVKVGEKTTSVRYGEVQTVYILEPTVDEQETAVVKVVFIFGNTQAVNYYELKTQKDRHGQVLLRVYRLGSEIVIERIDVVY
ncbi:MAG: hypothetical protein Kow0090_20600 [Myxococcota bacterium]